jgi:hypothetical protein
MNKDTIYDKGTPINSRAAILYNHYIKKHKLDKNYELIGNGEKIKYLYLRKPNMLGENVFGFKDDSWPSELKLDNYIDFDLQFQKTFMEPIDLILSSLGWTQTNVLFEGEKAVKKKIVKKERYEENTATLF